jgi:hypothetical protein
MVMHSLLGFVPAEILHVLARMLAAVFAGIGLALYHLSAMDAEHLKASADELRQLAREAVCEALDRAHIPIKAAAALMGRDESQLRKQLRGEPGCHLSFFDMLVCWPCSFWFFFAPSLMWLIGKKRVIEFAEDCGLRRSA